MQNRIQEALRQAVESRENALMAGDSRLKAEWLQVAEMWEAVATAYREIHVTRERSPNA